jgi:hypothetical protein
MATNLSLDPELLEKTFKVSGEKTKKAAVTKALQEFVSRHEQKQVSKLFVTFEFTGRSGGQSHNPLEQQGHPTSQGPTSLHNG